MWKNIETTQLLEIGDALENAHATGNVAMIIGQTGCGKTNLINAFKKQHEGEVFVITVSKYHILDDVIEDLQTVLALNIQGRYSKKRRLDFVIEKLITIKKAGQQPVLVIDEAENLNPSVLAAVKGLYDALKGYASIVLIGTEHLINNMLNLKQKNRTSLPQLHRRFKAHAVYVSKINKYAEYTNFFTAMGVTDTRIQEFLLQNADNYGELHDYLEPALRFAQAEGKQLTYKLFADINNIKAKPLKAAS